MVLTKIMNAIAMIISENWFLVPVAVLSVVSFMVFFFTSVGAEYDNFERKLMYIGLIIAFVSTPAWIWFSLENNKEKYHLTQGLDLLETQYPKYNYDKGFYCIFHEDSYIPINKVQGYVSDSATLISGVHILEKKYCLLLGIFEVERESYNYDKYIYTTTITPEIERVLLKPEIRPAKLK